MIKVRDCRRPGYFWADNELMDIYGPQIKTEGLAVYMALSRVANNHTGECVITLRQIADMVGRSPQTIMRAIALLEKHCLVRTEFKGSLATRQPSVYFLLEIPKSPVPIRNSYVPPPVPSSVPLPVPNRNTLNTNNTNKTDNTQDLSLFEDLKDKTSLPSWVPIEAWNGYVGMRKEIKAPLTARAKELEITKLDTLRKQGYDPKSVLDQSTVKCWRGLFAIKEINSSQNGHSSPVQPVELEDDLAKQRRKEAERKKTFAAKGGTQ